MRITVRSNRMTIYLEMRARIDSVLRVLAVLCVVLAGVACNQTTYNDGAIVFRTAPESHTRAAVESDSDLREACSLGGEAIGIVGVVSNEQSSNVEIFSNERLYYSDTKWTYDNPRYWVWGALHEFMAIYPHSESAYTYDSAAGIVERENVALGTANNMDLMWCVAKRDLVDGGDKTSPVTLNLHHAFALLEFRFVNASSSAVSSVDNISLEGVLYRGDFGFSEDGTSTLSVKSDIAPEGTYVGQLSATNIPVNLSQSYNLFENMGALVVMPQDVYKKDIILNMQIGGGVVSGVNLGLNSSTDNWEAGKKYIYTMTLTTERITFDVNVREWIDDKIEL